MKIIKNIIPGIRLFKCILSFENYKYGIQEAKDSGDVKLEQARISEATYKWASKTLDAFNIKLFVEGEENLPKSGPVLFVANHQGYADIIAFMGGIKSIQHSFVAKEDLRKLPVFSKWIVRTRGLYLKRGDMRQSLQTIKEGMELLKQGFSLVIFPEGTRSKGKEMISFKPGSFKLATKTKVPIVPVTLEGAHHVFEEKGYISSGTIHLFIHKPIETANLDRHEQNGLVEQVEGIIREKLKEYNEE